MSKTADFGIRVRQNPTQASAWAQTVAGHGPGLQEAIRWCALAAASLLMSTLQATAATRPEPRSLRQLPSAAAIAEVGRALAPLAFVRFCMRRPSECAAHGRGDTAKLDGASLRELVEVNRDINRSIRPARKPAYAGVGNWEIAPSAGDCNDYAVTKRHELIKRGWPSSALLLTEVETSWGEAHLVLTVTTNDGDYVLDNLSQAVKPWSATRYRWVRRQSGADPSTWVALGSGSERRSIDTYDDHVSDRAAWDRDAAAGSPPTRG